MLCGKREQNVGRNRMQFGCWTLHFFVMITNLCQYIIYHGVLSTLSAVKHWKWQGGLHSVTPTWWNSQLFWHSQSHTGQFNWRLPATSSIRSSPFSDLKPTSLLIANKLVVNKKAESYSLYSSSPSKRDRKYASQRRKRRKAVEKSAYEVDKLDNKSEIQKKSMDWDWERHVASGFGKHQKKLMPLRNQLSE